MGERFRWTAAAGTTGAASLIAGFLLGGDPQPTALTFLSVGQGDCAVFQHQGSTVLIDAGPANEHMDAGARLVTPALRRMGVTRIDLVVLSHPDGDHVGGLPSLCKRFRVGKVVLSKTFADKPEVNKLLRECCLSTNQILWTSGIQTARIGDFKMTFYSPAGFALSDNDASIVCRLSDGKASCLFTGDISSVAEDSLIAKNLELKSQILKVSHHGSRFSTDDAWLNTVKPEYAVVSVGRNNNYGHPSTDVLRRLKLHQAAILRTDLQGDLRFIRTGSGFALEGKR